MTTRPIATTLRRSALYPALLVLLLPAACDSITGSSVASLEITPVSRTINRGDTLRLTALVRDSRGQLVTDARVSWSSANQQIVTVSSSGLVTGVASGGPIQITARSDGQSGVAEITVRSPAPTSAAVTTMLQQLSSYIAQALSTNQDALPRNPQWATQIQAKIAMLQRPTLASEIIDGRFYEEGSVLSLDGSNRSVVSVFPLAELRAEAQSAVEHSGRTMVVLEQFMAQPFPAPMIGIWQGFVIGNSGGGGRLYMMDQATYESRPNPSGLPYHAIVSHEVAHSYISHEELNQFLELYAYNLIRTNSTAVADWQWTRGYVPDRASNAGVHALLDIYRFIGPQAMARAYQAARPLGPRYGEPLTPAVRQVFVDAAPDSLKAQVAAKIATLTF